MAYLVVLNDGETYTDLDGCEVLFVEDDVLDKIEKGVHAGYDDVDEWVKDSYGTGTPIGELVDDYFHD